ASRVGSTPPTATCTPRQTAPSTCCCAACKPSPPNRVPSAQGAAPADSLHKYLCAMHIFVPQSRYDQLDELLTRIAIARQRPSWRGRVLDGSSAVTNPSTLRMLRAVQECQQA